MRVLTIMFSFIMLTSNAYGQTTIDGTYDWQTEAQKKFNIYVPSSYSEDVPNKLIVGFHPFNPNRWDSEAWRDTLIQFAESVDAILLCTDGGLDGKVDDQIDTSFTSFMIDSIQNDFNIDTEQVYGAGFSWGGRTTYTYGLHRPGLFNGHLVIGAAINGLMEVGPVIDNSVLKSFYLVHGTADSPNTRFFPVKEALEDSNACVETNLMQGIGHTIDFPNRNEILKTAFEWLESRNCGFSSNEDQADISTSIYPNPTKNNFVVSHGEILNVYNSNCVALDIQINSQSVDLSDQATGVYYVQIKTMDKIITKKIIKID